MLARAVTYASEALRTRSSPFCELLCNSSVQMLLVLRAECSELCSRPAEPQEAPGNELALLLRLISLTNIFEHLYLVNELTGQNIARVCVMQRWHFGTYRDLQ